jgi:ABC-type glucose/galactose transport system permease subunit
MRLLSDNSVFYDCVGNVPVGCYRDRLGRYWLGDMSHRLGGWQLGFVPIERPAALDGSK